MKTAARCLLLASIFLLSASLHLSAAGLLIEAEAFADRGGWSIDPQFSDFMGSPYLLAHGLGTPVADAVTTVTLPQAGTWRVWVRTRDWTPDFGGEKPGRFQIALNGATLPVLFGIDPADWGWVNGGTVELGSTALELRLHDLTGFNGRCDAIYLTTDIAASAPPDSGTALAQWRAQMHGETTPPAASEAFDLVVVGGGFGGCGAAIAAARSGLRVAFVQDRPVLGGNASQEIRVASRGDCRYRIVDEIDTYSLRNRSGDTVAHDDARLATVQTEPNITLFMPWRAYAAGTNAARRIMHVDIRHISDGQRRRLTAPLFVDATGDGWVGHWAGADWRRGREARAEHNESLAPQTADTQTLGNSLMWTTKLTDSPVAFPTDLPWAASVAGTATETGGEWDWEYGIQASLDTIWDAEHIRDHLLRAIYGNFANAKANPDNANRAFDWVPYIAGKRESRRQLGPYILTQSDILVGRYFEDAVATTDWGIDLHRETSVSYRSTYTNHGKVSPCYIPYRCLFSRNVPNLFLAGRNISVTHVGLGSPRVMNTIGQFGVVIGYAAAICKAETCDPADIYRDTAKFADLRTRLDANAITPPLSWPANPWLVSTSIVDNLDTARATTFGEWLSSSVDSGKYGSNYLHDGNTGKGQKFVLFQPDTSLTGDYTVSLWNSVSGSRAKNTPVWVFTNDTRTTATSPNAYGRSNNPLTFFGGAEFLVGRDIPDRFFRGYLRFDLSALPPDTLVGAVNLTLTINHADTSSDNSTAGAAGITVHALTESFDPESVTWNNRSTGVAWTDVGGTFTPDAATVIAAPPFPPSVTNGQVFAFPSTADLRALVANIQTNGAPDKHLYLVVRTPDLEKTYSSRKLYRFVSAQLDVVSVDPTVPPTTRIDLTQQQAQWRDIGTFPVGSAGIRVMIGNDGTTQTVTADAVRVTCVRSDIDPNDYDGNGLPNDWERRWFLQETGTDPDADPDGDGKTNLEEFQHNTNPLDPNSRPGLGTRVTITQITP